MINQNQSILYIHSNADTFLGQWHVNRVQILRSLGHKVTIINMTDYLQPVMFPMLNRMYRRRESNLMRLYRHLEPLLNNHDVLIHFGGALVHPDFLSKFRIKKVYHCADDPDSSDVLSKPVAAAYDLCAVSNPSVIDMYKVWGCPKVVFWPLGGIYSGELIKHKQYNQRQKTFAFVGSKYGVPKYRGITKIPFFGNLDLFWNKKKFLSTIERCFPEIYAYGPYWSRGFIDNNQVNDLYNDTRIGLNLHNSLGPINTRLYDLPAHGVLQICDNKNNLNQVFSVGEEIVGYETLDEAVELMHYYSREKDEAKVIANAGRQRYLKDYRQETIMLKLISFFNEI